jgi:hypothetical protein
MNELVDTVEGISGSMTTTRADAQADGSEDARTERNREDGGNVG